jgi:methylenetetrahydrofolate reductase (NADPH)
MTRLTELIARREGPFHTFEFFPPRTEAGFVNLLDRINRLSTGPLPPPLAISVTWGAGGSTADRTMELAESVIKLGLDVILHLTCTNMPKEKVDQALKVGPLDACHFFRIALRCSERGSSVYTTSWH